MSSNARIVSIMLVIRASLLACQKVTFLTDIGLEVGEETVVTTSGQCKGAWTDGKTCLKNPEDFETAVNTYLTSLKLKRQILRAKTLEYYTELVSTRITKANKSDIFDETTELLFPRSPNEDKYKFGVTFDHCLEDLNTHVVHFICQLTSEAGSDYFISETQTMKLHEFFVYDMLKNCLEMGKTFCMFLRYYQYVFTQRIGAEAAAKSLGLYTKFCNNTCTECAANYSSETCYSSFKTTLVSNLFTLRGIGSQDTILALLLYVFEGRQLDAPGTPISTVKFLFDSEGYAGSVSVMNIDYSISWADVRSASYGIIALFVWAIN